MTANASDRLVQHYVDNFRRLPWRAPPNCRAPDPYRVWLSEIMLQQTSVAAVIPRFERFVERWPTIEALAAASDSDVLAEWAGLGYYARARNLIACARQVAARGGFPRSAAGLRELPGIGAYTSAAIAAIAFSDRIAAVDTNVERVIARLHGLARPVRGEIERLALAMMPATRPGDFVQALFDLGATLCRPRKPDCAICPLRSGCVARASGAPEGFPEGKSRAPRVHKHGIAYWTERDGAVWLMRRPASGLLGGMAALPGSEWGERNTVAAAALGTVRHIFTHITLDLVVVASERPFGDGWWQPLEALGTAGLPTLYRRAAAVALGNRGAVGTAA